MISCVLLSCCPCLLVPWTIMHVLPCVLYVFPGSGQREYGWWNTKRRGWEWEELIRSEPSFNTQSLYNRWWTDCCRGIRERKGKLLATTCLFMPSADICWSILYTLFYSLPNYSSFTLILLPESQQKWITLFSLKYIQSSLKDIVLRVFYNLLTLNAIYYTGFSDYQFTASPFPENHKHLEGQTFFTTAILLCIYQFVSCMVWHFLYHMLFTFRVNVI